MRSWQCWTQRPVDNRRVEMAVSKLVGVCVNTVCLLVCERCSLYAPAPLHGELGGEAAPVQQQQRA